MRAAGIVVVVVGLAAVWSCSGRRQRPPLPAPEYERHEVAPWDAGKPVDPLDDDDAGDWVDDEEDEPAAPPSALPSVSPSAPDSGPSAVPGDAAAPELDAGGKP